MVKKQNAEDAKPCKGVGCGHKAERGYDTCRSCEAKARGVPFVRIATERSKKSPFAFRAPGY